jgi:23S rRNA (cytosine1962-C5)-methyltransferase
MSLDPRKQNPIITYLKPIHWRDYELIDSGFGSKLEKIGPYILQRPEAEAIWKPNLPQSDWQKASASFLPGKGEEGGQWDYREKIPGRWVINFGDLKFWVQLSSSRHIGIFPEQAPHWEWMMNKIASDSSQPMKVLNLFGYSGIATLAAASAGAKVTHVDASQKAIYWARENQVLSGLADKPIRWIVDDALKFVRREKKRGNTYDGIILDPPKFGRGPKGEVWEFYKLLPVLLDACRDALSTKPKFIIITAYAVKASSLTLFEVVRDLMSSFKGETRSGELVLQEKAGGRLLSKAIFAIWSDKHENEENKANETSIQK